MLALPVAFSLRVRTASPFWPWLAAIAVGPVDALAIKPAGRRGLDVVPAGQSDEARVRRVHQVATRE
eukprot:10505276-Alexandrium_andersonii.AAC.1